MEFVEFKLPDKVGKLFSTEYFLSYVIKDHNGLKVAFCKKTDGTYDIVFDFKHAVEDWRISKKGCCLDNHMTSSLAEPWLLVEIKDSEYLKRIDKEVDGILTAANPNLKHYMIRDTGCWIDIISIAPPEVYKTKGMYYKENEHAIKNKATEIKIGKTRNGETVISRDFSGDASGNKPTLEILKHDKYKKTKIRYND